MRRLAAFGAAAVVLGGIAVSPPAASAHHDLEDFTVFATVTDTKFVDEGEDGPSEGDRFFYAADLADESGDDAGTSRGGCKITEAGGHHKGGHGHDMAAQHDEGHEGDGHDSFAARCFSGFALDDGKLFVAGEVKGSDFKDGTFTLPIRGGRGDYEDAEGDAIVEFLGDGHHGGGHDHEAKGFEAAHDGGDHGGEGDHDGAHFKVTFEFD